MYRYPRQTATLPTRQPGHLVPDTPAEESARRSGYRLLLLFGALACFAVPVALFEPALYWAEDPELYRLLRGMAGLKGVMALTGLGVVAWRLRRAIPSRMAGSYIASAWALALASALIWELQVIPLASTLFHGAILWLLITAWRDSGSGSVA